MTYRATVPLARRTSRRDKAPEPTRRAKHLKTLRLTIEDEGALVELQDNTCTSCGDELPLAYRQLIDDEDGHPVPDRDADLEPTGRTRLMLIVHRACLTRADQERLWDGKVAARGQRPLVRELRVSATPPGA